MMPRLWENAQIGFSWGTGWSSGAPQMHTPGSGTGNGAQKRKGEVRYKRSGCGRRLKSSVRLLHMLAGRCGAVEAMRLSRNASSRLSHKRTYLLKMRSLNIAGAE